MNAEGTEVGSLRDEVLRLKREVEVLSRHRALSQQAHVEINRGLLTLKSEHIKLEERFALFMKKIQALVDLDG